MTMPDDAQAQILRSVTEMLQEVIGEEWIHEMPITMETTFARELEVESIELVVLFEKLRERFGESIDFPGWLAGMEIDEIVGLTVGRLVEYIATCQSKP